jgi:hypothetical protein
VYRILVAAAAGCAFTAAVLTSVGLAEAAPSGAASVAQTVSSLQMRGYTVIVNGAGSASLDQCTTYSVRHGQTFTRMDSGFPGAGDDIVTKVVSMTVFVDAHC